MRGKKYNTFSEFYPFYLSQHRHPVNKWLHVVAVFLTLTLLIYVLVSRWWLGFLALFVVGYGTSWIGHVFFEKNQPATFQFPFYSLMGDLLMFKDTLSEKFRQIRKAL